MSLFGALNTAYSGLIAAQKGLEVVGQNMSNVNTDGYTRQRLNTSAAAPTGPAGGYTGVQAGQGVTLDSIARLGSDLLDTRVRTTTAVEGYTSARADALGMLESNLHEPGDTGISAGLQDFWASWQALSNQVGDTASGKVLLQGAQTLVGQIAAGYRAADAQWAGLRAEVGDDVTTLNNTAASIAKLNDTIRTTLASGGSANELIDQRSTLTTSLAHLAGASVRAGGDGTIDVLVGGVAIVSGTHSRPVALQGAGQLNGAAANPLKVVWADSPATPLEFAGGTLGGKLSVLAPADGSGGGGAIAEAAASYNALAQDLATRVNALHETGAIADGTTGHDFFALAAGVPAALGLSVLPASVGQLAAGAPGAGAFDGSIADAIAGLGTGTNSPDELWTRTVTGIAVASAGAQHESSLAGVAANSAVSAQVSNASVSLDEENVQLLAYQHAYQGAARVLTAIDAMLDQLINHTGLVGR